MRSVAPLLVALFVVVPLAELAVILRVGDWLGLWPTLGILVADSLLGSLLMRTQGRAAWRRFTEATRAGRPPAREVLDGVLIILGGALLLTPGFLTDLVGLSLLAPPTRAVVRRVLVKRLGRRMVVAMTAPAPGASTARPRPGGDVEGNAQEIDPGALRAPRP